MFMCVSKDRNRVSVKYSRDGLGPSWAVPGLADGSLSVLASADSGPETQPAKI